MANPVVQWQIVAKDPEALASFYSTLFGWNVDDIDGFLKKAESLGAKTLVPRQELPGGDTMAFLIDPAGHSLGLYTPASRASASSRRR